MGARVPDRGGCSPIFVRAFRLTFGLAFGLIAALASGCYRPRVVDCVVACNATGACPESMSCSVGLCTRGQTCVLDIAAGATHSCALVGGDVECWGDNRYGQLGIGSRESRGGNGTPFAAVDLGGRKVIAVAAGGRHSCALASESSSATTAAICWGDNRYGQLGIGSRESRGGNGTPFAAVDLGGRKVTAVAAGGRHSCALASESSSATTAAICWGDDTFGQLGIADGRARGAQAGDVLDPVPLGAGRSITTLATGLFHTCALLQPGGVVCWGDNRFGQLGVPDPGGVGVAGNAAFAAVTLEEPARAISAGAYHTCAVLASGGVRCWGWNDYRQLGGVGGSGDAPSLGTVIAVNLPPAKSVAAGAFHTCALLATGAVTCWGQDEAGQVGRPFTSEGSNLPPGDPVDLGPGRTGLAIAAGASHSCALLDDFSIKCWGFNADGELGVGDVANRGADGPTGGPLARVALGPNPVSHLALGANHTCAIQADGVKCWGLNKSGQLGTGDTDGRGDRPSRAIDPARLGAARR